MIGNKRLLELGSKDENSDDGGSDSEPSEDNLEDEEIEKLVPIKKRKRPAPAK